MIDKDYEIDVSKIIHVFVLYFMMTVGWLHSFKKWYIHETLVIRQAMISYHYCPKLKIGDNIIPQCVAVDLQCNDVEHFKCKNIYYKYNKIRY